MTIDFQKELQEIYLNIRLVAELKLTLENSFDNKVYTFLIDEYCTFSNGRFSLFEIPTYVFDELDKGSYHYEILNLQTDKRILSGSCLVKDSNYVNVEVGVFQTGVQLNNLDGMTNENESEQQDFGWFD